MNTRTIRFFSLCLLALTLSACGGGNTLTVINRSGQTANLTITIDNRPYTFENLTDGESRSMPFTFTSDDHFLVEGALADGTTLLGNYGYVTHGMDPVQATFTLQFGGQIEFEQK